jgi:dTDP-4-dehydrorhamnose reductase
LKEKLLITGGSGLLAINWALATRDRYEVTLGLHIREVSLFGVESKHIPLESVDGLASVLEELQPDLVIHTAGLTNIEECEVNPELAYHINVELAENVAKACLQLRIPLVHISTDHLFSGESKMVDENHNVEPMNNYARTKAEAEMKVLEIYSQALVVRTNFYGWGPSYRQSFSDIIITTLRAGSNLTLFHDVFYTPILIETLICAVLDLVTRHARGIFNVVGDERISKYQFGVTIAEQFQLDSRLIGSASLADRSDLTLRPNEMSLSNDKVCTLLGRKMGGIDEQLQRLLQQERLGLAKEVRCI